MPIENRFDEEEEKLIITLYDLRRGLDTTSSPIAIAEGHVPGIQNMNIDGGFPTRIGGSTLHDTSMDTEDGNAAIWFARYTPAASGGTARYLWGERDGTVRYWNAAGDVSVHVFQHLSTYSAGDWSSHVEFADYLIVSDTTNGNWKWNDSTYLPVGAKSIATMESGEDSQWANETAETTTIVGGIQSYKTGNIAAGGDLTLTFTPTANINFATPLLSATNYTVANSKLGFFVRTDNASEFEEAVSSVVITDGSAATLTEVATGWIDQATGSAVVLADDTWFRVELPLTDMTDSGSFDLTDVDTIAFKFSNDNGAAETIECFIDQCYLIYTTTIPAGAINEQYRNMFLTSASTANPSEVNYSKISAPDEWDAAAILPISDNDGQNVTGFHNYFDQMVVTKDNSIHTLAVKTTGTTYPSYTWGTRRVTTEHGCSSHRTLLEAAGRLYMLWQQSIYVFEGLGTKKISYIVDPTLEDRAQATLDEAVMAQLRDQNLIFLWWPGTGDGTNANSLMYNHQEQAFLAGSGQVMAIAETVFDTGIEYLVTCDESGNFLAQDTGTDFNGSTITAFVTMPWVSGGRNEEMKSWDEVLVQYQTNTGNLIAEYRIADHPREFDAASYTTASTIAMDAAGNLGRVFVGTNSRWIQFRFRTAGAAVSIYWPVVIKATPLGVTY